MIELEVQQLDGKIERFKLEQGIYQLGKAKSSDICLVDSHVSQHHANLVVSEFEVIVKDVGSTNGIWLNGERITDDTVFLPGLQIHMGNLVLRIENPSKNISEDPPQLGQIPDKKTAEIEKIQQLKREVHQKVIIYLDEHKRGELHTFSADELRFEAREATKVVIKREHIKLPGQINQTDFIDSVVAESIGLGPIEPLQNDESVTEIMVNGYDSIYVERNGKIEETDLKFSSTDSLMGVIERIVTPLGRRIDEGSPMVDARLSDGSRVNAIIPPLALNGPTVTIRKFSKRRFGIDDLLDKGTLNEDMAAFLKICVEQRRNIMVSGGTGSGKTTTLNILSNFIPERERIVTIEDAAEVQLHQKHVITLEARPANIEGKGLIAIRDLVKNSLRMRPDRIIVGECRGGEALDMLQAMNTGHDGSLTTGHANSPRDILSRLEVMVLMAGMDLPVRAIREQISSALDIILQQTRFSDGTRRITSIVEVDGMESDVILLQKIFEYKRSGRHEDGTIIGEFRGLGFAPSFYEECAAAGEILDRSIFGEPIGLSAVIENQKEFSL